MATYVVGDPHGCLDSFLALLRHARVGADDRVVVVGDLVNRGPDSLGMVRWVRERPGRVETVLGNHDVHMLLVRMGIARAHPGDTTRDLLEHPEAGEMCDWLRSRPFSIRHGTYVIVHAGVPPGWDIATLEARAGEIAAVFRSPDHGGFFRRMLGNRPDRWEDARTDRERWRYIVNALTRMRMCRADSGALDFSHKGPPDSAGPGLRPWFDFHPGFGADTVVFGHWASLGERDMGHAVSIDAGCAWGRRLCCLRLEDRRLFSVPAQERPAR